MAEIEIKPSAPFVKGKPPLPRDREGPSFGETFSSNWSKVLSPIVDQNKFFTNSEVYDEESQVRVDNHIDSNDLSKGEEQHLKMFGIGSAERFAESVNYIRKQRINNDILNRSSGGALIFSDPSVALSFFVPVAGVQFSKLIGKALYTAGNKGGLRQIARANELMSGKQLTREQITKISALDGLVTGGTMNLTDALTEIGLDTNGAGSVVLSATLSTMADGLISGAFGYGLGTAFARPKAGVNRAKIWSTQYKAYLNSVNDKPLIKPVGAEESVEPVSNFKGPWYKQYTGESFENLTYGFNKETGPTQVKLKSQALQIFYTPDEIKKFKDAGNKFVYNTNANGEEFVFKKMPKEKLTKLIKLRQAFTSRLMRRDMVEDTSWIENDLLYLKQPQNKNWKPFIDSLWVEINSPNRAKIQVDTENGPEFFANTFEMYDRIAEIENKLLKSGHTTKVAGSQVKKPKVKKGKKTTDNDTPEIETTKAVDTGEQAPELISYGGKWFNESWFGKMIPSPLKATVTDKNIPQFFKAEILALGGANGLPLVANQMGQSMGNSVYINAGRRQGEWYAAMDIVNQNYRKVSPRGKAELFNIPVGQYVETVRAKLGKTSFAPVEWQDHLGRLIMDDVPYDKMTPEEAASTQAVRAYFEKFGGELEEIGLIKSRDVFEDTYLKEIGKAFELTSVTNNIIDANKKWMAKAQAKIQKRYDKDLKLQKSLEQQQIARGLTKKQVDLKNKVDDNIANLKKDLAKFEGKFDKINNAKNIDELASLFNDLDLTPKMRNALESLSKSFDDIRFKIDNALEIIEHHGKLTKTNKYDLPRIFNRQKIHKERDGFRNLLIAAYKKNPTIISRDDKGLFQIQKLATDPASLYRRAEETIQNIMEETDEDAIDAIFTGFGRSGPLVSRRLNVPNSAIKEYLVTDVKELMINYGARVAPKLEYHKANLNPDTGKLMTLEENLFRMRAELNDAKVPRKSIDKFLKNYVHTYDRVVGTTLKRADSIDTRVADMLRTATSWTFLGGSGVAAFGDAASIFMDHELNVIGRSFLGLMDDISLKHSAHELKLSGEALEMTLGTTHLRYMESLSNDLFQKTLPDKLNNAFFVANGLGPVTVGIKMLDGLVRGHTIIDSSIKLTKGTASDFEKEFLARYNITLEMAERISKMPHQKSTGGDLILPNTEAWTDLEAVAEFRNALRSGVMNRVIMGGPEDKPITMDGVAYIPDHVAKTLPYYDKMPRDPRVKGYVRVESGFLALPFTFYSFVVGALNKITGNMAAGSVRNKTTHIAVAMMLGYSVTKFRTPEWAWDEMDMEDKIMRSFDMSGIAALQSDLLYRAITMAHELGAEDGFPIQPKYSGGYDPLGSFVSLGGAPADWTLEVMRSITQMIEGDVGEGAKSLVNMIPLIETMATGDALKDTMKDIVGELPNRP